MDLERYGEPWSYEIALMMEGLQNPDYPLEDVGDLSLEISEKLRCLAIVLLLTKGNTDLFCHNLIRSGMARMAYLERLVANNFEDDHHRASGRFDPLLDTIAGGDLHVARRIVQLSPTDWRWGQEYEDDYCYAQVLHRFVQNPQAEGGVTDLLQQLETWLDGEPSARLDVCQALLNRDQPAFDEAFGDLLNERDIQIEADKARSQMDTAEVMVQRYVSVEGLAVLRLANMRGLKTQDEYTYCPSVARIPMQEAFPGQ